MVLQKNDVKTCLFLKMPKFHSTFLYYIAEMSKKKYPHCIAHVLRFPKHI